MANATFPREFESPQSPSAASTAWQSPAALCDAGAGTRSGNATCPMASRGSLRSGLEPITRSPCQEVDSCDAGACGPRETSRTPCRDTRSAWTVDTNTRWHCWMTDPSAPGDGTTRGNATFRSGFGARSPLPQAITSRLRCIPQGRSVPGVTMPPGNAMSQAGFQASHGSMPARITRSPCEATGRWSPGGATPMASASRQGASFARKPSPPARITRWRSSRQRFQAVRLGS
jgi:hypothetical protein